MLNASITWQRINSPPPKRFERVLIAGSTGSGDIIDIGYVDQIGNWKAQGGLCNQPLFWAPLPKIPQWFEGAKKVDK